MISYRSNNFHDWFKSKDNLLSFARYMNTRNKNLKSTFDFEQDNSLSFLDVKPLSANPTKWSNTLKQFLGKMPTNCLSVFDYFVKQALKGLRLPADVKDFQLQFFARPRLVEFFTSFDGFIFEFYKTGLIFTLLFRCFTICSNMQSFHLEVEQLQQIFKCNSYPVTLIGQCVKTFLNKILVLKRTLITVPKKYF